LSVLLPHALDRVLTFFLVLFIYHRNAPSLHSFPTRRSSDLDGTDRARHLARKPERPQRSERGAAAEAKHGGERAGRRNAVGPMRSEEHTSELQSRENLVCRLLLEKKKELKLIYPKQ